MASPARASAGVGFSENPDTNLAGAEAASEALKRAGVEHADLVMLFATALHDQARLLRSVRSVVGSAKIVGGGAGGVLTNDRLDFGGCSVGVAVLASQSMTIETFLERGLDAGPSAEFDVGHRLGTRIRRARSAAAGLVLLYECVKKHVPDGAMLNMGTPLLEGMGAALGTWPPVVGAGLLADQRWRPACQFVDDELAPQSALAILLSGNVRMSTMTTNGLRPMSTYREITAADGPTVLAIDGRPALEVIQDLGGPDLRWQDYPLTLTLGVNSGDPFGPFREDAYSNYLCVAVDRERRGLVMSDTYLRPGTRVQLMRRSNDFTELRAKAEELVASVRERQPFFALYIDCAGRSSRYLRTETEDAAEIQQAVGDIPLLGIYSGSEIARVGDTVQRLNHAGILALLHE